MFACEETCKACEESGKACEESSKASEESGKIPMWKYLKASFWEKGFFLKKIYAVQQSVHHPSFRDILVILAPISTMISHWNKNWIIFAMVSVSTHSSDQIKTRVFVAHSRSTLSQT